MRASASNRICQLVNIIYMINIAFNPSETCFGVYTHRGILVFYISNLTVLPVNLTAMSYKAPNLELVSHKKQ
jgi:hypothetical protein